MIENKNKQAKNFFNFIVVCSFSLRGQLPLNSYLRYAHDAAGLFSKEFQ